MLLLRRLELSIEEAPLRVAPLRRSRLPGQPPSELSTWRPPQLAGRRSGLGSFSSRLDRRLARHLCALDLFERSF